MNDATIAADRPLAFPFAEPPGPGELTAIVPGLMWARLPLPYRLNHVNVWLLDDGNDWTVVDTGADTAVSRRAWEQILSEGIAGRPVGRLVATHGHPDHIGLAGWLVDRFGCPFHSTEIEWMTPQLRRLEVQRGEAEHAGRFLLSHGCTAEDVKHHLSEHRRFRGEVAPLPAQFERLRDGETITLGERQWRVIVAGGHATGHASLYCHADRILIAGDQILPTISPMIGVWSNEPLGDPLADYLASLPRFMELPEDILVLPSHGMPFKGIGTRARQLAHHHDVRLAALEADMDEPKSGMVLASTLFQRAVAEGQGRLALAETLAHAHRLVHCGRAERLIAADGAINFRRA